MSDNTPQHPEGRHERLRIQDTVLSRIYLFVTEMLVRGCQPADDNTPPPGIGATIYNLLKVVILCFFGINIIVGILSAFCYTFLAVSSLFWFRLREATYYMFSVGLSLSLTVMFALVDSWFRKHHSPDWSVFKRKGKDK